MNDPQLVPKLVLGLVGLGILSAVITAWAWALTRRLSGRPILETRPTRIVPWGGWSVLAVFVFWIGMNLGAGLAFRAVVGKAAHIPPLTQLVLVSAVNLVVLAVVPLILRVTSGARSVDFGLGVDVRLGKNVARGLVAWALAAPVIYLTLNVVIRVWKVNHHPLEMMVRAGASPLTAFVALLAAVVLAPAAEELIFRAVLQGWLVRLYGRPAVKPRRLDDEWSVEEVDEVREPVAISSALADESNIWAAPQSNLGPPGPLAGSAGGDRGQPPPALTWAPNAIASFLFAAIHFPQWPAPVPLFLLSLVLGTLYQRTGSVVAPFALHAVFNGISTGLLFLSLALGADVPK